MNHLKDYLKTRVEYMLTYADENAKGFFKKQGFSETILIDRKMWRGYIKDYDSATLRCCRLFPQVNYSDIRKLVSNQWESVYRAAAARSHHRAVYTLPPEPLTNVAAIPGLVDRFQLGEEIEIFVHLKNGTPHAIENGKLGGCAGSGECSVRGIHKVPDRLPLVRLFQRTEADLIFCGSSEMDDPHFFSLIEGEGT